MRLCLILLCLFLTACDSKEGEEQEDLPGSIWQWKSFEVNGARRQIEFGHTSTFPPEQQYVLFFREPYVSHERTIWSLGGILDCNQIDGGYAYSTDGMLSIPDFTVSLEACGGSMEGLFIKALLAATRYETRQDTLRLYGQDTSLLEGKPVVLFFVRTTFPALLP